MWFNNMSEIFFEAIKVQTDGRLARIFAGRRGIGHSAQPRLDENEDLVSFIIAASQSGMKVHQIAKQLKISISSVTKIRNDNREIWEN